MVRGRKGEYRKEIAEWQRAGFQRLKIDGEFYPSKTRPTLDKKFKHDIDVVVDRIVTKPGMEQRLANSLETALRLADGIAVAEWADVGRRDRAAAAAVLGEVRLPGLGLHHQRDRAAAVLVQQPLRRLPGLRRPRAPSWRSTPTW